MSEILIQPLNAWCGVLRSPPEQVSEGQPRTTELVVEPDAEVVQRGILAANRARKPLNSWGRSRHSPKALKSLS